MAMPRKGTKNSTPKKKPQNMPHVAPLPTGLVVGVHMESAVLVPADRRDRVGLDDEVLGQAFRLGGGPRWRSTRPDSRLQPELTLRVLSQFRAT